MKPLHESLKYRVNEKTGCWEFTGAVPKSPGYGVIARSNENKNTYFLAHRVAYEHFIGSLPEGQFVLHKCDNRKCVNPKHLVAGTHKENMNDKMSKQRQCKGERQHLAVLTEQDVKEIRTLHVQGHTQIALGKKYNVDPSNVGCIVHRKTWKHVA